MEWRIHRQVPVWSARSSGNMWMCGDRAVQVSTGWIRCRARCWRRHGTSPAPARGARLGTRGCLYVLCNNKPELQLVLQRLRLVTLLVQVRPQPSGGRGYERQPALINHKVLRLSRPRWRPVCTLYLHKCGRTSFLGCEGYPLSGWREKGGPMLNLKTGPWANRRRDSR